MAVIDLVKWNGNPSILAWRFPSEELSTWTQLIVNETQEAYLVKEGVYEGPFGAGRHTLSTDNIPLLRSLIGLPFGDKSPFTAEVWYINKIANLDIRWGTPDPIQLQDPKYEIMIPVRAFGQYGIQIIDAKKFLLKLVGTLEKFDINTLTDYFRGVFTTKIKTAIAISIIKNGVSVLEISAQLELLSDMLKESLAPAMEEYGVGLSQFNIHSINVPEDDPAVLSLKSALAKRTEMGLLGFNYQQEKSFDVLKTAAGNEGTAGGVMGAGMGLGLGMGMGVPMGGALTQLTQHLQTSGSQFIGQQPQLVCARCNVPNVRGTKFCSDCGFDLSSRSEINKVDITCDKCNTSIPKNSKFCPNCSDPVNPCLECGQDNPTGAKLCRQCGAIMPIECVGCNALIGENAKFCPECGIKTSIDCKKCGSAMSNQAKFCNSCGEPQSDN